MQYFALMFLLAPGDPLRSETVSPTSASSSAAATTIDSTPRKGSFQSFAVYFSAQTVQHKEQSTVTLRETIATNKWLLPISHCHSNWPSCVHLRHCCCCCCCCTEEIIETVLLLVLEMVVTLCQIACSCCRSMGWDASPSLLGRHESSRTLVVCRTHFPPRNHQTMSELQLSSTMASIDGI